MGGYNNIDYINKYVDYIFVHIIYIGYEQVCVVVVVVVFCGGGGRY